jgi:hypothetical protein
VRRAIRFRISSVLLDKVRHSTKAVLLTDRAVCIWVEMFFHDSTASFSEVMWRDPITPRAPRRSTNKGWGSCEKLWLAFDTHPCSVSTGVLRG